VNFTITQTEREYLRDLAREQLELSQLPIMHERVKNWTLHNDLKGEIPMIHFEMATVADTGFYPVCKCESPAAREIEHGLLTNMMNHKMIGDDRVVPSTFHVGHGAYMIPFNMHVKRVNTDGIGYHIEAQIEDLERDFDLIKPSEYVIDSQKTAAWFEFAESVIGDILPVERQNPGFYACLTNDIVHRMSMENMFTAMFDAPDKFHAMMDLLSDNYVEFFKSLEREELLVPTNSSNGVGQGTFTYTNELPKSDSAIAKTTDCWGYMDSQETVGISPSMFHEFFFPYYQKIAKCFGLLSYGCCEPVDVFWDSSVSKFDNLRKVSISAWCNEEFMGERLRDTNAIFHRKPSPNFIGTVKKLDENAFREHIRKTLTAARGCKLEITFRDVYNLEGDLNKPRRAVEIVREEIERNWK